MVKHCNQGSQCLINKKTDTLSPSDQNDVIYCHVPSCNLFFHAKCIGWTHEDKVRLHMNFVCNKCKNYLDTLRSLIAEEVHNCMKQYTHIHIGTSKENDNSIAVCDISTQTDKEETSVSTLNETNQNTENIDKASNETMVNNLKLDQKDSISNENYVNTLHVQGDTPKPINDKLSNSIDNIIQTALSAESESSKITKNNENNNQSIVLPQFSTNETVNCVNYLCGIETSLKLCDVKLILDDYKIYSDELALTEVQGNFRSRRFIKIETKSKIAMFKFKNSLDCSQLKNTWFLRSDPPKQHQNSRSDAKIVKIEYRNFARDKVLFRNNNVQNFDRDNKQKSIEFSLRENKTTTFHQPSKKSQTLFSDALKINLHDHKHNQKNTAFLGQTTQQKWKK